MVTAYARPRDRDPDDPGSDGVGDPDDPGDCGGDPGDPGGDGVGDASSGLRDVGGPVTASWRLVSDRSALAFGRLKTSVWSIVQLSVGAGVAWQLAVSLLGHPAPFFAPIGVLVCLGLAVAHRVRRVAELAVGVTLGVALGELVVSLVGRGAWQLTLVVALALVIARLLDRGVLIATQAALQAVLVLAIPPSDGSSVARWADAMIGGAVALVLAVLTPPDPRRPIDARADAATAALVDVLRATAAAVRAADADAAGRALTAARRTQDLLDEWADAVATGEEVTRVSPLRRRLAPQLAMRRRALTGMDRAARNTRVLVRRLAATLDDGGRVPVSVAEILEGLVAVIDSVDGSLGASEHPELATAVEGLAKQLDVVHAGAGTWVGAAAVAQLRAVVVDVLTAGGISPRQARRLLPDLGSATLSDD